VFEAEHGEVVSSLPIRRHTPVEEYLRPQRRFAHLFAKNGDVSAPDVVAHVQSLADRNIERYGLLQEEVQ
jgi:pyruvate ferredoxin oxidoreductase beta subunit